MSREMGWKQFQPDEPEPWTYPPDEGEAAASALAPEPEPEKESPPSAPATTHGGGLRLGEPIWLCLVVVDAFLALDFLLRAIAAHGPGFVAVVTGVGDALASPFASVFAGQSVPRVDHTTFWAALVAIVVYTLAAWLAIRVMRLLAPPAAASSAR